MVYPLVSWTCSTVPAFASALTRTHALYADKRRLVLLSDAAQLQTLVLPRSTARPMRPAALAISQETNAHAMRDMLRMCSCWMTNRLRKQSPWQTRHVLDLSGS